MLNKDNNCAGPVLKNALFPVRKNLLTGLFLIAFSISVNIFLRLGTFFLPGIDAKARLQVYNTSKDKISSKVKALYPDISQEDNRDITEDLFRLQLKKDKAVVQESIRNISRELKDFWLDEEGWPYLLETDSYRWYRRINNFLNTGRFGSAGHNNKEYDALMSAPFADGQIEPLKLHFYTGAYFHKFLRLFDKRIALFHSLAVMPVILSVFMVLIIFSVCSLMGLSWWAGCAASLLIGLSRTLLFRSSLGWFDTDIYNIIFPLFVLFCAANSFRSDRFPKLWLCMAAVVTGIYSSFWSVWWFIFYLLVPVIFFMKLSSVFSNDKPALPDGLKKTIFFTGVYLVVTYISVFFFSGIEAVKLSLSDPFMCFSLRENATLGGFWPAVSSNISELRKGDINLIFGNIGGIIVALSVLFSLFVFYVLKRNAAQSSARRFLFLVLSLWLFVMFFLTFFASRFIIFLVVPVGFLFGACLDFMKEFAESLKKKSGFLNRLDSKVCAVLLNSLFLSIPLRPLAGYSEPKVPSLINDSLWEVMLKVKDITPENAIINANWQYGDWIMSIGERRTLICPAYQHSPVNYWILRVLISVDEKEAVGILRMLNSGGNRAFDELVKIMGDDKFSAIRILNQLILLNESAGRNLLAKYTLDNSAIDSVLKYMYKPYPDAYMFIHSELLDVVKNVWMTGSWDFDKLDLYQKFNSVDKDGFLRHAKEKLGYSDEQARHSYDTLSVLNKSNFPKSIYKDDYKIYTKYSQRYIEDKIRNLLFFDNGIVVDTDKKSSYMLKSGGWITAGRLILSGKDKVDEYRNKDGGSDFTVVCSLKDDSPRAILLSSHFADSLFSKLCFLQGAGLTHFSLAFKEEDKNLGNKYYLYKINW